MASATGTEQNSLPEFSSQIDKYYTTRVYEIDGAGPRKPASSGSSNGTIKIFEHSNHVAVIALDSQHPLFSDPTCKNAKVVKFSYILPESALAVRGKRKNGAKFVKENEILARFELDTGRSFKIPAGVGGRLLELNRLVSADPDRLLRATVQEGGFVAIVLLSLPARSSSKKRKRDGDTSGTESDDADGRD